MKTIKLYKYCRIPECQHWSKLLSETKFSRIYNLNDPFEGFLKARDENGNITNQISNETFVSSYSMVCPYVLRKDLATKKKRANLYMWSHYSDALNGICLEYDFVKKPSKKFNHKKISYDIEIPNTIDCFSKYKSWDFEKEYRFSFSDDQLEWENQNEIFKPNQECSLVISVVYLGVRMLGKNIKYNSRRIKDDMKKHPFYIFLKSSFPHIEIRICVRHRSTYNIIRLNKK